MTEEKPGSKDLRVKSDIDSQIERVLFGLTNSFKKVGDENVKDLVGVVRELYKEEHPEKIVLQTGTTGLTLTGIKDSDLKSFILLHKKEIITKANKQEQNSFDFLEKSEDPSHAENGEELANLWVKI